MGTDGKRVTVRFYTKWREQKQGVPGPSTSTIQTLTVGPGFAPGQHIRQNVEELAGCYRRWGITPRPEVEEKSVTITKIDDQRYENMVIRYTVTLAIVKFRTLTTPGSLPHFCCIESL